MFSFLSMMMLSERGGREDGFLRNSCEHSDLLGDRDAPVAARCSHPRNRLDRGSICSYYLWGIRCRCLSGQIQDHRHLHLHLCNGRLLNPVDFVVTDYNLLETGATAEVFVNKSNSAASKAP